MKMSPDCIDPVARNLAIVFTTAAILTFLTLLLLRRSGPKIYMLTPLLCLLLTGATLWLGSYSFSPILHYVDLQDSTLLGLQITSSMRSAVVPANGAAISLVGGSPAAITALTIPAGARCLWSSNADASMDGSDTCDLIYLPPSTAIYDVLRVHVIPGCSLPEANGQLKINIFP
jgi:hypothetical protein